MFKELERDPKCCSCDQKENVGIAESFPRFKEIDNKAEAPLDYAVNNVK